MLELSVADYVNIILLVFITFESVLVLFPRQETDKIPKMADPKSRFFVNHDLTPTSYYVIIPCKYLVEIFSDVLYTN